MLYLQLNLIARGFSKSNKSFVVYSVLVDTKICKGLCRGMCR